MGTIIHNKQQPKESYQQEIRAQRANLLLLLEQAIRIGIKKGNDDRWKGSKYEFLRAAIDVGQINRREETSSLILGIDYRSSVYLNILELGRKSLSDLKSGEYTMNVSEFIRSFLSIPRPIAGKKFLKLKDVDEGTEMPEKKTIREDELKIPTEKKVVHIGRGVTGKEYMALKNAINEGTDSISL